MTVKLSDRNGNETVLKLSMQTVTAILTALTIAVISGIVIWVNALSVSVNNHASDIAVLKQVDTSHSEMLKNVDCKLDKLVVKTDEIREDQLRRQRTGK